MSKSLTIDSFPFNNELSLLEVRLEELNDVVDYHILIESSRTQSRLKKPFHFKENVHLFEKFKDKIISVQLDEYKEGGPADWSQERFVRDSILDGLKKLEQEKNISLKNSDHLIISDLDEIPMASKVKEIVSDRPINPVSINHYFISYFYNLYCPHRGWWGSVVTNFENIRNGYSPQTLRDAKDMLFHEGEWDKVFFGWHFSSCADFDGIWNKWLNNIEPHDKSFLYKPGAKEKYRKLFYEAVVKQKRFFYCDDILKYDIKLEILPIEKLPTFMQNNIENYKHLLIQS
mgnify:CR=1 FL=1